MESKRLKPICIKVKITKTFYIPGVNGSQAGLLGSSTRPSRPLRDKDSGPGLQREPQGQLSQMIHVRLFASLLDVIQSFHLERRAPPYIWLHSPDPGARAYVILPQPN